MKKIIISILCFLVPVIILLSVYISRGVYPFGDSSVLVSDMFFQYIDYHAALHDILKNFDFTKIIYNWNMGLGGSFIGLFSYYLSSPFTFLILFFSKENLPEALLMITLLKVGTIGLTFHILLKSIAPKVDIFNIIYATCYALSSFVIIYSYNIMWLDAVILLPLLIKSTDALILENKYRLFTWLLLILFISNFYMSYMVGIFCFLYFILRLLFSEEKYLVEVKAKKIGLFFSSTFIAILGASIIILPTIFNISSMGLEQELMIEFSISDWIINFPGKFFLGAYDSVTHSLSPNIYFGIFPLLLVGVYFLSDKIKNKEKLIFLILLLILFISFYTQPLNLIGHAFDYPNWFPNRFSFIFSFIMLLLSYKGLRQLNKLDKNFILSFSVVVLLLIMTIVFYKNSDYSNKIILSNSQLYGTFLFLIVYFIILNLIIRTNSKFNCILLVGVIVAELFTNTALLMKGTETQQPYYDRWWYRDLFLKNELITDIITTDNSFYRLESDGARTSNDSLSLNYNSFSHFSSLSNQKTHQFLNRMFYYDDGFLLLKKYGDGRSTQVIDSIFGIKYIVSPYVRGTGYELLNNINGFNLYENKNALSLAFVSSQGIRNLHLNNGNPFINQEILLNTLSGQVNEQYYYEVDIYEKELENIPYNGDEGINIRESDSTSNINFKINVNIDGPTYLYYKANDYYTVYVEGKLVPGYLNDTIYLGDYHQGDSINISIRYNNVIHEVFDSFPRVEIYSLDSKLFKERISKLKEKEIMNLEVKNNYIKGDFNLERDSTIFTTIPYDDAWRIYCNDEAINYFAVDNAFIGFDLSEGYNEVSFKYIPKGLITGSFLSVSTLSIFIFYSRKKNTADSFKK